MQEIHDGLDFSSTDYGGYSFGIFCVKFSKDGRELVAGSSDNSIYVYDLEANKISLRILAHTVLLLGTTIYLVSYNLACCLISIGLCNYVAERIKFLDFII